MQKPTRKSIQSCLNFKTFPKSSIKKKVDGKLRTIYFNDVVLTLDIETTSYYTEDMEKRAIMYIWQMTVDGEVIIGRTWTELVNTINDISDYFKTNYGNRVAIYVHNFAYEFGFLAHWFEWDNIFSLDVNKPIRALTTDGVEFRCSYALSSLALRHIPDQISNPLLRVEKMIGDLDYKLIRNSLTELTDEEMGYCINDVKILHGYVTEKMIEDGGIARIKMTNTSYVRDYVRNKCLPTKLEHVTDKTDFTEQARKDVNNLIKSRWHSYRNLMSNLILTKEEYILLKKIFGGGYTHASAHTSGKVLNNIDSFDEASAYPAKMLADKFPMGRGRQVYGLKYSDVLNNEDYCFIFEVEIKGLEIKEDVYECYISKSKMSEYSQDSIFDNGRLYSATKIKTSMTNVDLQITLDAYNVKGDIIITNCYKYKLGYLPKPVIESVLHFYEGKTTLKGLDDRYVEYNRLKGMLNSCFGMVVTDIARDNIDFSDLFGWSHESPDLYETIEKYNNSTTRFLYYPWGVFITAYARRDLWGLIIEAGEDYHYSDTDSVKMSNAMNHMEYINNYNKKIEEDLTKMAEYYNIDTERLQPKNIKGVSKLIGIWEHDGKYKKFKTLGAKRYMFQKDDESVEITVAGVAKSACSYLVENFGEGYTKDKNTKFEKYFATNTEQLFDTFADTFEFPAGECGKSIHTYKNHGFTDTITDYQGNTCEHTEMSFIHLEETGYNMKIGDDYSRFLQRWIESDEEIL